MQERLQVVDENDQPVGVATREEAWAKGLILRNVFIILRDDNGNFLLQQRSMKKKSAPGKWTFAASGHVDEGETYEQAAPRELFEEIGVDTKLSFVGKTRLTFEEPGRTGDYFVVVYSGTISHETPLVIDPEEVDATQWLSPGQLATMITSQPDTLSPKLIALYNEFFS